MKLTGKLVLAMTIGILVIEVADTWLGVENERALWLRDVSRDHRRVGLAFANAVSAVWTREGEARARWLVKERNASREGVGIRLVTPGPDLAGARHGQVITRVGDDGIQTFVPLSIEGVSRPVALEIDESLDELERQTRASLLRHGLAGLATVFFSALLVSVVAWSFVGRPLRVLTKRAREIAGGDLKSRVGLTQRDELADFAEEMNRMSSQLAEAGERLKAETDARVEAVEALRHADRLRTVGQLASGLAHELGTPLNVVSGRARLIEKRSPGSESAEDARIVIAQAARMTALLRQVLDFARRKVPPRELRDLREVCRETAEMLAPLADKQRVTLEVVVPDEPVPAEVDATQLQQALTNLVVNGIAAMPRGGSLALRAHQTRAKDRQVVALEVEDEGEGIAPEHMGRLFEPFFTTKGVGEGTGLGLAVTHGIVEDHDGWIEVDSEVGRGSRFTILLPSGATA